MERHLDDELEKFTKNLLKMATLTEESLQECIAALQNRNKKLAEKVIQNDNRIDEFENIIEEQAIELHALFQPMAVDLRFISAGQHISTELERAADLIVNIAQRIVEGQDQVPVQVIREITQLAHHAREMVTKSIDAFLKQDDRMAQDIILADKTSNKLRTEIFNELIEDYIKAGGDAAIGGLTLILITRDLERIADHATAIAEEVIYLKRAKMIKHHLDDLQGGLTNGEAI